MKITLDKNTKAEQTISQNKAQTLTLALPEKVSTHLKESVGSRRTVAQVLLKHKGNKQQDNVRGRTILTGQELTPKSEAKQVVMKDGAVAKANSGQLQDQPHTNASLGVMKVTNGTAKLLTIQTKDNTKKSLHPSTMAEKHVTQSSAHTLIKKVKTGSVNASNVVKTVDSTKTATSNIVSGKAVVIKDKQATSANQAISVKGPPSDVKPITEKPDKTVLSSATTQVTGGNTIGKDNQASAVVQITTIKPHDLKPKTVVLTPSKTMTTSGIAVSKDRPTASVNQKTVKTSSDLQPNTDQTILTVVRTTQSRLTKPTSVSGATTITKDNFKASVHRSADAVSTKDNPVEHLQVVVTKSATTNAKLSAKDKPTATANQTAQIKSNSNEKAEKTTISLGSGKAKETQKSQELLSVTSVQKGESSVPQLAGATTQQKHTTRGGGGLGSVKVSNVSSYSFTLTWSAPQGMFKNFTVVRREQRIEAEGAIEQEATTATKNTTASLANAAGSRGKAEEKRVSVVLPGNVRSVEFGHLQANTLYFLQVFGTASGRRSKIHRISRTTGPEPATELVFSNVTESSVTVSWSKLNSSYTGFRVTYTNSITGESHFKTAESQRSHVVLSQLAAGSSYIITVTTTQGEAESDALTSLITTVPAPPVLLRAVNVSDTKALLQWSPGLGAVDGFIISYESAKIPNVTVTVSGSTVEHQLRALQRGTVYTVKALSQKNGLQSPAVCTTFTTASTVKASAVGPRFAVITWRASGVSYQRYRITYHVVGGESKEVILDQTITEYQLTGLLPMTRYMVLVQGERDDQYTSIVTSEFVTGKLRFPWPMDCSEELLNGALQSGEVDIYPNGKKGGAYRVYCDMETDGGGWTVFQRRMNGNTEFYRTWKEYSVGFGNVSQEFWLGNELLHNLTRTRSMGMRVELRAEEDTVYAHYTNFTVDSEEHHYSIMLSGYTGTAGDSMRYHNGRPFSTYDKDPDSLGLHCAKAYMGGWWYKNCYKTNLNGLYNVSSNNQGVVWIDWKGKDSSLPSTEMKIRPAAFSPSAKHG
ncbi:hypothetical protein NHX12_002190 [Muraenolepis orangiensis]|uniref:Tenascin n=1 Tax=Muraenolepis orangiensis TaxID=630683 RepID=A0A9Q0E4I6_9TELE|nr:hypothetical protein NHX12_002190 [Muraenolepis orangiensis]